MERRLYWVKYRQRESVALEDFMKPVLKYFNLKKGRFTKSIYTYTPSC